MTPDELKAAQDAAIAACDRTMTPTEGGLAARVAAEHDAMRRTHGLDSIGHEMAAKALTKAAICERENAGG